MPVSGPTINHSEIRAWATRHHVVPTELLPCHIDHEPTELRLMFARDAGKRPDIRIIGWNEFFARFDLLGLAFVYDEEKDGFNQLLQREEREPHIGHAYRSKLVSH